MVMGLERAIEVCKENNLEAYFIYSNEDGSIAVHETEGMKRYHK
jgi:hypothetical protein